MLQPSKTMATLKADILEGMRVQLGVDAQAEDLVQVTFGDCEIEDHEVLADHVTDEMAVLKVTVDTERVEQRRFERVDPLEVQLREAASQGNVQEFDALLLQGCSIDARDISGATPLICAVRGDASALQPEAANSFQDPLSMVQHVLSRGAQINLPDTRNKTAFIHACEKSCAPIVEYLVKCGCDTTVRSAIKKSGWEVCRMNLFAEVSLARKNGSIIHECEIWAVDNGPASQVNGALLQACETHEALRCEYELKIQNDHCSKKLGV